MKKQTSSHLLRLGINKGWNFNFLGNLKFYSFSLKRCLFLFLLVKTQLIKKKFWLVLYFIFFTLKKCLIKLFFWQYFLKNIKLIKFFKLVKLKKKNIKLINFKSSFSKVKKIKKLSLIYFNGNLTLKKKIKKKNFLLLKNSVIKKKFLINLLPNSKYKMFFKNCFIFFNKKNKLTKFSLIKIKYKKIILFLKKKTLKPIQIKKFFYLNYLFFLNFFNFSFFFFKKKKLLNFFKLKKNISFLKRFFFINKFFDFFFSITKLKKRFIQYLSFFFNSYFNTKKKTIKKKQNFSIILQKIYLKLWQLKIKKLILKTNLIKKVELTVFDIIKIFRKSKKRFLFEKNLIFVFSKKLPFFAKILLAIDPFLIFNLIKLFSLVFKIIGTSNILGKYLVYQIKMLRKHWHFFRLLELVLNSYWKKYSYKIKGCKFALIGKINGSARTRKLIINVGSINIQKFSSLIDYSLAESFSLFGIFGIKIWLQFL